MNSDIIKNYKVTIDSIQLHHQKVEIKSPGSNQKSTETKTTLRGVSLQPLVQPIF
ncbi:hypothetical protein NH399_24895 [Pleionea sp. CnH1-48]|nr:hypothetical protein [Pleionea sp. CnH1-48]